MDELDALEGEAYRGRRRERAGAAGCRVSNARLAVLPATTHYDVFFSPALASAVRPFLDVLVPEDE